MDISSPTITRQNLVTLSIGSFVYPHRYVTDRVLIHESFRVSTITQLFFQFNSSLHRENRVMSHCDKKETPFSECM